MRYHRLLAAATGLSVALSAAPALAMDAHLDSSVDAQTSVFGTRSADAISAFKLRTGFDHKNSETKAETDTATMQELRKRCEADAHSVADCTLRLNPAGHINAGAAADASHDMKSFEKMTDRMMHVAERLAHYLAKMTKRMCGNNPAAETVSYVTCMENAKVSIKAKFAAMIDAAFSA